MTFEPWWNCIARLYSVFFALQNIVKYKNVQKVEFVLIVVMCDKRWLKCLHVTYSWLDGLCRAILNETKLVVGIFFFGTSTIVLITLNRRERKRGTWQSNEFTSDLFRVKSVNWICPLWIRPRHGLYFILFSKLINVTIFWFQHFHEKHHTLQRV